MTVAEKGQTIPEGQHTGKITRVEQRKPEKYDFIYNDVFIKLSDVEGNPEIKNGYPDSIKVDQKGEPTTALARLLTRFGIEIKAGQDYNVNEILSGQEVKLVTVNEQVGKGVFARVADNSLKPQK